MMLPRKAIHIHVTEDMHIAFRKLCIENRVTMQEVCEYFITGILDNDPLISEAFRTIVTGKKKKSIKRVSKVETDSLYDAIDGEK